MHAPDRDLVWTPPALLAAASLPSLLAFNEAPSATFLNQALAFLTWGLVAAAIAWEIRLDRGQRRAAALCLVPAAALLAVMALGALTSQLWGSLPAPLALSSLATLAAAAVLLVAGARAAAAAPPVGLVCFEWLCLALVVSGVFNAAIALVQTLAPAWADGQWIARSSLAGRAVGNLRQPNHVCSLLLWAVIGVVAGVDSGRLGRRTAGALLSLFALALVMTASRTAVVVTLALALWGALDRRLRPEARRSLVATPLLYGLAWAAMAAWSRWTQSTFAGEQRLGEADLSASRFRIWSDTLQLIREHPWTGVGFGDFNFAWSLSVLPRRPVAFFDHTHNLLLQWAVELGLPAAALLTLLLLLCLVRVARGGTEPDDPADPRRAVTLRLVLAALLVMVLHSLLEYPLWYAYFLLPTAWLLGFGVTLARRRDDAERPTAGAPPGPSRRQLAAGVLVALGAAVSVADYASVVRVFDAQSVVPLPERIARGQRSWFFAHHADYAAATVSATPERELDALRRAAHYLLDTRLMTAWAEGLAAAGDAARARYLADRLREFRNPNSAGFFAACAASSPAGSATASQSPSSQMPPPPSSPPSSQTAAEPAPSMPLPTAPGADPPFQCQGADPRVVLDWADFR